MICIFIYNNKSVAKIIPNFDKTTTAILSFKSIRCSVKPSTMCWETSKEQNTHTHTHLFYTFHGCCTFSLFWRLWRGLLDFSTVRIIECSIFTSGAFSLFFNSLIWVWGLNASRSCIGVLWIRTFLNLFALEMLKFINLWLISSNKSAVKTQAVLVSKWIATIQQCS